MLVAHSCSKVAQLGEKIVEEVSIIGLKYIFKTGGVVEQLVLI